MRGMVSWLSRSLRRPLVAVICSVIVLVMGALVAFADSGPTATFASPLVAGGTAYQSSASISVTWTEDDPSGSGIATRSLLRQKAAVVTQGTCAGVTWADDGAPSTAVSPVAQADLSSGYCYRWQQTLTDNNAGERTSVSGSLIVDAASPSAPSVTAVGSSIYQSGTTIYYKKNINGTVTITATSAGSPSGVASIDFGALSTPSSGWDPTTALNGQANGAERTFNWQTSGSNNPTFTVKAWSRAGVSSTSSTYSFEGDPTIPGSTFSAPAANGMSSTTSYTVAWSEFDTHSGVGSRLLQRQRAAVVTPGTCAGVSWTNDGTATSQTSPVTQSGLADGYCYRWQQTLTDRVGNGGAGAGTTTSSWVLLDTTPPEAPSVVATGTGVYQAAANDVVWFRPSAAASISLSATGTDPQSGISGHIYGPLSNSVNWMIYSPGLTAGNPAGNTLGFAAGTSSTSFTVRAQNQAGGVSASTTVTVTADSTAPVTAFTSPSASLAYQSSDQFAVAWTESDAEAGVGTRSLQRQRGMIVTAGTCAGVTWANDGAATTAVGPRSDSGLLSGYCYRWSLAVTDRVGNQAQVTSGAVLVDAAVPSTPTVTLSGSMGSNGWYVGPVTVTITANDNLSGLASITYNDGGVHTYAGSFVVSAEGTTTLWAIATDRAGNVSALAQATVHIDTQAASVNFFYPSGSSTQFFGINASDSSSGIASYRVIRERSAWNQTTGACATTFGPDTDTSTTASGQTTLGLTWSESELPDVMCHRWRIQVTDVAGNVSTWATSGPVTPAVIGGELLIVDCESPNDSSQWVTNRAGVIYWQVGRPLCVRPGAQLGPGAFGDGSADQPWQGRLIAQGATTVVSYSGASEGLGWITLVDRQLGQAVDAATPLRLRVNHETSGEVPWVTVTYRGTYEIGWYADGNPDPIHASTFTVDLRFRIVAVNLGTTP